MKQFYLFAMYTAMLCACSGPKVVENIEVNLEDKELLLSGSQIEGLIKDYIEIEDGMSILRYDSLNQESTIMVMVKLKKQPRKSINFDNAVPLQLLFIDANGNELMPADGQAFYYTAKSRITRLLKSNAGFSDLFKFKCSNFDANKESNIKLFNDAFAVKLVDGTIQIDELTVNDDISNYDAALNNYELYVDYYIKCLMPAKLTDNVNAMQATLSKLQLIDQFTAKLDCITDFSKEQSDKLSIIKAKLDKFAFRSL